MFCHCGYNEFKDDIERCKEGCIECCDGMFKIIFGLFNMCNICCCYNKMLEEQSKIENSIRIAYGLNTDS